MSIEADPVEVAWFWEIIESSQRSLRKLCGRLEGLTQPELIRFQCRCWHAKEDVNPFTRFDEMKLSRPCSEDHGDDFSGWVIGEGRVFFEQVRDNPAEVQKYNDLLESRTWVKWDTSVEHEEYEGYQRADLIAKAVYERKFGEDLDEAVDAALDEEFGNT